MGSEKTSSFRDFNIHLRGLTRKENKKEHRNKNIRWPQRFQKEILDTSKVSLSSRWPQPFGGGLLSALHPPGVRFCLRGNGNIPQTPGVSAAINYTFNNVALKRLAYGYKYPTCPRFVSIYRRNCLGRLRSIQTRFNKGYYKFIAGSLRRSFKNIFILFLFLSSSSSSFSYVSALYPSCPRFTLTFKTSTQICASLWTANQRRFWRGFRWPAILILFHSLRGDFFL